MKQCLIIDDSRVIRKVARRILEDLQFKTEEAEDMRSALDQCRRAMPDAVLLDWNMPGNSGADFLRSLRRETGGAKPVVLVCTTENDLVQISEAVHAGASEYVLKPFDHDSLRAKLAGAGLIGG